MTGTSKGNAWLGEGSKAVAKGTGRGAKGTIKVVGKVIKAVVGGKKK